MANIDFDIKSQVAFITLNNSNNGNRLNMNNLTSINQALDKALENKDVRAILLRSNGTNFCLGMDLSFLQTEHENKKLVKESIDLYQSILLKIFNSPKPVIAFINGDVKAGGIGLIAACDINLASTHSTFELSEVFFGLIPANVFPFLIKMRLPLQKVKYLTLTAKKLNAVQALSLNLVDEVFEEENLEKEVKNCLKNLLRAAPHALSEVKSFTYELQNENLENACMLSKDKLFQLLNNQKVINGISAFNEGDIPEWFAKFKTKDPILLKEKTL